MSTTDTAQRPADQPRDPHFAPTRFHAYTALVVVMVSMLLVSNICATKGVTLFPALQWSIGDLVILDGIPTDGAFLLFPLTYVIGDIISEIYGFRAMRRAVIMSFGVTALAALAFTVAVVLPAAPWYENQAALESVVGVVPRILLASVVAFVLGELVNSKVLVMLKRRTGERGLVGRLVGSTVLGQLADTTAFGLIAAPAIGLTDPAGIAVYILVGFVWKTVVEACMLPVTVPVIAALKRHEPDYHLAT